MDTRGRDVGIAILMAVLVGGCTGSTLPATDQPVPSSAASARFGAPVVTNPVDVSGVVASPCRSTLTDAELRAMGISGAGSPRSYLGAVICSWRSDSDDRLSLSVDTQRDLLVDSYRTRLTPIFEPRTIEGFPAVRQRTSRDVNTCTVTTGVGPRQALEADWTGHRPPSAEEDPCARAEEAIALVVRKLPPQR